LIDLIRNTAGIEERAISEVKVFDRMSLVTVPFAAAEDVIRAFAEQARGRAPLIREDRGRPAEKAYSKPFKRRD